MAQSINKTKIKQKIIDIALALKSLALILFGHLKNGVNFLITKIDTKKSLSVTKKATLASFLSYSIVFAGVYYFFKDNNFFHSVVSSFKTSSVAPLKQSETKNDSSSDIVKPTENVWLENNPTNCQKVTDMSDQYLRRISNKFNTSMSNIKFLGVKLVGNSCVLLIDSPHGGLECPMGGVIWLKSGTYVATELYKGNEPNTYYSAFGSCSDGNFNFY